jgi:hypothetical protein
MIDNVMASACVQEIREQIESGRLRAIDILPEVSDEPEAFELFNAWSEYFIDRMRKEYDKQGWFNIKRTDALSDLEYDVQYHNRIVGRQKAGLKD